MKPDSKPLVTGRFSEAEKARMYDLAGRFVPGRIAGMLNRKPSSVYFFMVTNGLYVPKKMVRQKGCLRKGREVRSFTAAEDRFISRRRRCGVSYAEIAHQVAERFGYRRPKNSIGVRLRMLAAREEADAAG